MSWKDVLKEYNPKEMDAKRAKMEKHSAYLRRKEKQDEKLSRDLRARMARREADANLIDNLKSNATTTTKRTKKKKKGRLPPKPLRGGKK